MKILLLFLLLSFAATVTYAQADTTGSAGKILYTRPGFWKSEKFTVNGQQETFKEVSNRLAGSKASAYEFSEYKKDRTLTYIMATGVIVCVVSALPLNYGSGGWKTTQSKVAFGVGCGFLIPEFIFAGKRNRHFWKAVRLYNTQG